MRWDVLLRSRMILVCVKRTFGQIIMSTSVFDIKCAVLGLFFVSLSWLYDSYARCDFLMLDCTVCCRFLNMLISDLGTYYISFCCGIVYPLVSEMSLHPSRQSPVHNGAYRGHEIAIPDSKILHYL